MAASHLRQKCENNSWEFFVNLTMPTSRIHSLMATLESLVKPTSSQSRVLKSSTAEEKSASSVVERGSKAAAKMTMVV